MCVTGMYVSAVYVSAVYISAVYISVVSDVYVSVVYKVVYVCVNGMRGYPFLIRLFNTLFSKYYFKYKMFV